MEVFSDGSVVSHDDELPAVDAAGAVEFLLSREYLLTAFELLQARPAGGLNCRRGCPHSEERVPPSLSPPPFSLTTVFFLSPREGAGGGRPPGRARDGGGDAGLL